MTWLDNVSHVLDQYKGTTGAATPANATADFQKVAQAVPPDVLSEGVAHAIRSPETPHFGDIVTQLFGQSNSGQRVGILNHLLPAAAAGGASGGILGRLSDLVAGGKGQVTPAQAQQVSPEQVKEIATQAAQHDPSIIDRASQFYAQHPTLVQGLGAGALAMIMSHVSKRA